jgi:glycosyltransferase involved in cell wall biosynthesis
MQHYCNYLLTGMIAVSHAVARVIHASESFSLKKIRVIWNGEDLAHFSPGPSTIRQELDVDDSICLMTCVGSLTPVKDHVTQLKAFARLTPQYPNARLILVGDGPERSQLKELSTKLKLTEKVHFLGHRTDIANILRGSDLYLQSSTTEGFSNAIVQAMAVGLPVVATDVGGNPELVSQDGGILIPPRNPEQLANALLRMVNDKGLRSIMGRQARERVEQHCSIDTMVSSYLTAFEQAIENRY